MQIVRQLVFPDAPGQSASCVSRYVWFPDSTAVCLLLLPVSRQHDVAGACLYGYHYISWSCISQSLHRKRDSLDTLGIYNRCDFKLRNAKPNGGGVDKKKNLFYSGFWGRIVFWCFTSNLGVFDSNTNFRTTTFRHP